MKIVADREIPFLKGALEPFAEVVYRPGEAISAADLADADALLVRTRTKCNALLLSGSKVRLVASATSGVDHIDAEYCRRAGIEWSHAPGSNAVSVLQYVAAAVAELSRRRGRGFAGTTAGVVGVGHVGSKVATYLEALGLTVLRNDPPRERREGRRGFVSLSEILARCDLVTLHVPLNREGEDRTLHLFDRETLGRVRPGVVLVNTSRGEVVETGSLKEALRAKRLGGCVLDVWENEPAIDRELLSLVDLATPHIAGYSLDGKANATRMSVRAVARFFGLPLGEWAPSLPPAAPATLDLPGGRRCPEELLGRAILRTYDIASDDRRLRASPEGFERQRAEYPPRRDFSFPALEELLRNEGVGT